MKRDDGMGEGLLYMLASRTGCDYLSDLCFLDRPRRARVVRELASIPPQAADLAEWNEALWYLLKAPPQDTEESARRQLMEGFSH